MSKSVFDPDKGEPGYRPPIATDIERITRITLNTGDSPVYYAREVDSAERIHALELEVRRLRNLIGGEPRSLPPLPEGAVYLGRGGEFEIQDGIFFDGWVFDPDAADARWIPYTWRGKCGTLHFAAPADSEIARLNGLSGRPLVISNPPDEPRGSDN